LLHATIFPIGDYTNDFEPGIVYGVGETFQFRQVDALADGIFAWEIFADEGVDRATVRRVNSGKPLICRR
jgi:hypothetical protein